MTSILLKWISGGIEAFLGIPFLGGTVIIMLGWTPLGIMFVLHIITLVFSVKEGERIHGSILGIVTSLIGWIPFLGWLLHVLTAVFLLLDAYKSQEESRAIF